MYNSPIDLMQSFNINPIEKIIKEVADKENQKTEEYIMTAIRNVGVNVDKDELIKALNYDRGQYEKGFQEGKAASSEMLEFVYSILGLIFSDPCEYELDKKALMDYICERRPEFCKECGNYTSSECWKIFFEVYKEMKDEDLLV